MIRPAQALKGIIFAALLTTTVPAAADVFPNPWPGPYPIPAPSPCHIDQLEVASLRRQLAAAHDEVLRLRADNHRLRRMIDLVLDRGSRYLNRK